MFEKTSVRCNWNIEHVLFFFSVVFITMTSFEEAFAAINTCPDERAAGVISGSDPYRELELYLEKVNVSWHFSLKYFISSVITIHGVPDGDDDLRGILQFFVSYN